MPQIEINYLAVLAAAVSSMVIGALWYSPVLFAKSWMAELGKKQEDLQSGAGMGYLLAAVAALVEAYVLAHIVNYAQATTLSEALQTGAWVWLGFVATTTAINYKFQGKSLKLYVIDAGNHLAVLLAMATILTLWQ